MEKKIKLRISTPVTGDPEKPAPPTGYKPLSVQQRKDWNDFLDYMEKSGIGGKPELDRRDQFLGLQYLDRYRQMNPKTTVTKDIIPFVQYEQNLLRKGTEFPGLKPEELAYMRKNINPAYFQRPTSNVDSWLGSLTSRSYYPTAHRGTNTGEQYDFGPDFESFIRSQNNPELAQKYRVNK